MSRNRYELITRFLHFNNSQHVPRGEEGCDPLFKVRRLLDIVDPPVLSGKETFSNVHMVGDSSVTEQAVLHLADGLQNSGHIIYTHSFYTSPNLVRELQRQGVF
ncbi:hypothetical protein ACOMHN_035044 [Nucella lapillus]